MIVPPRVALLVWVPLILLVFRRVPIRIALLINFVGGWAVLPAACYISTADSFPYWIVSTSLESNYLLTKATIIGFTGILAVFIFDRPRLLSFRLTVWDLAMTMWLMAPLLSAIANPDHFKEGLVGELYQILAWGSPYIIGRLYFFDTKSLRLAAQAFVIGGLFYVPICIYEFFAGPRIYVWLYGYLPFQMIGAKRFLGYRPIGLLENGNQLGIWLATATLIAWWLWRRKTAPSVLGIPIGVVAVMLLVVTVLCQSTGAIILLFALIPFVFVDPRHLPRLITVGLVLGILAFAGSRLTNVVSLRSIQNNPTASKAIGLIKRLGKGSLTWRLSQDERHINTALEEPILGYGQWDWWREGFERPWSLWLLVFGMYGGVGLVSVEAVLLIPALRAVWFPLTRSDIGYTNMRHTLSAAVLVTSIDSLLNSSLILPLLLVIGGMTAWSTQNTEVVAEWIETKASTGTLIWRGSRSRN